MMNDIIMSDGLRWYRKPGTDYHLAYDTHEDILTKEMMNLMPEGGVFVDIGAHVGRYALRMAKKASKVFAFEPNPQTYCGLVDNCNLNPEGEKVYASAFAMWDKPDVLEIATYDNLGQTHVKGVWHDPHEDDEYICAVPALSLDSFFEGFNPQPSRIDLIKIDVEGAEGRVVQGMKAILKRYQPIVYIELHDPPGDFQPMWEGFDEVDYHYQIAFHYGCCDYLIAKPRDGPDE